MAPTNKGKEVVRKGQQKQQAGPSTPKRGKAKPEDAVRFNKTPSHSLPSQKADALHKAKTNNLKITLRQS